MHPHLTSPEVSGTVQRPATPGRLLPRLFVLVLIAYPFHVYGITLAGGYTLTLDRIILLVATYLALLLAISAPRRLLPTNLVAILIAMICVPLFAVLTADAGQGLSSEGILFAVAVSYLSVAVLLGLRNPQIAASLHRVPQLLIAALFLFSAYAVGYVYLAGSYPDSYPLADYLGFLEASDTHILRRDGGPALAGRFPRFAMPFGRPQDFGFVAGLAVLLQVWSSTVREPRRNISRGAACVTLLGVAGAFLSGSRSAMLPLLLAAVAGYAWMFAGSPFSYLRARGLPRFPAKAATIAAVAVLIAVLLAVVFGGRDIGTGIYAHLEFRQRAVAEFLEGNTLQKLFGQGPGYVSAQTEIGSTHMTYATLLVDYGLFGLSMFAVLLSAACWAWHRCRITLPRPVAAATLGLIVFIITANALYNFTFNMMQWAILGLLIGSLFSRCASRPHKDRLLRPRSYDHPLPT